MSKDTVDRVKDDYERGLRNCEKQHADLTAERDALAERVRLLQNYYEAVEERHRRIQIISAEYLAEVISAEEADRQTEPLHAAVNVARAAIEEGE